MKNNMRILRTEPRCGLAALCSYESTRDKTTWTKHIQKCVHVKLVKSENKLVDYSNVHFLVVILMYCSYATCHYWGKLSEGNTGFLYIISYK